MVKILKDLEVGGTAWDLTSMLFIFRMMANVPGSYDCNDEYDETTARFDLEESDLQLGIDRSRPVTPLSRPIGYPPNKRRRPLYESNGFNSYTPHPYHEPPSESWYEYDGQIRYLIESQKKMMGMFEKVSERIGGIEEAVKSVQARSPSSSGISTSPEEKKRIPSQISVSLSYHA